MGGEGALLSVTPGFLVTPGYELLELCRYTSSP